MIKSVKVTNHLDESITLELRSPEKSGFFIRDGGIDGLGPSKATINTTEVLSVDGARINSVRVNSRNIVFKLGFLEHPTIENSRHNSYKYFPISRRVKIEIETDTRSSEVYGYVESNEPDIFSDSEGSVISIICPDAWLYSRDKTVTIFSGSSSLFQFPFSNESLTQNLISFGEITMSTQQTVYYPGDAPIGVVVYIHVLGGPVTNLRITNTRTREVMSINTAVVQQITGAEITAGDDIIISTVKGDKGIYLIRNGIAYNILNSLGRDPDWFQLEKGDNLFAYAADTGMEDLQFRIENQVLYEGI